MKPLSRILTLLVLGLLFPPPGVAEDQPGWWMTEPVRFLQTNISEKNSTLDPIALVDSVDKFGANTLLFNMGGIVAQYPTAVDFHYPSEYLPSGRDLFGDVLREAHARGMRVVGRFDLSKTQKPVYDAHPEWFFKRTNGEPAIYNGLYSACINGGYYRQHAEVILSEALERYPVDGLFFNMFGNPRRDYSGREMGPCQCDACQVGFADKFGYPLPTEENDDYRDYMRASSREVAQALANLIHRKRPAAAFLTYIHDFTDGIMSESNTSVTRPLPMWPYSASDNVNRARNSEPAKMSFNLCMSFVDFPWRYVTVPQAEIRLRLFQNLAHGGPPALVVVGPMDQEDRRSLQAAQPIFRWHRDHEDLYVGQRSAARVMLISGERATYRGLFRFLTEEHIPFAVSTRADRVRAPEHHDLVIVPSGSDGQFADYVRRGGRLLVTGASTPQLPIANVVARRDHTQGAWRIHRHSELPSLKNTNLLFLNGPYVELMPQEQPWLTLIPPAMFGPPEKVWVDKVESRIPGLVFSDLGSGRVAYIPWDIGEHYYYHGSQAHADLLRDVVGRLLSSAPRQLETNAHPLVEITLMEQPSRDRLLVHFVNLSGHTDTAYFEPLEMRNISVTIRSQSSAARAVRLDKSLPLTRDAGTVRFTLPTLQDYEVVVLDHDD